MNSYVTSERWNLPSINKRARGGEKIFLNGAKKLPGVEAPPPAGAGGTTCDVNDGSVIDNDGGSCSGNGVRTAATGV